MPPRAVIAEDEGNLREQLREALAQAWPELQVCAEAADGREALRMIEAALGYADVTEVASRGALGVSRAHTLGAKPLGLELDVGADLLAEVGVGARPAPPAVPRHASSPPPLPARG